MLKPDVRGRVLALLRCAGDSFVQAAAFLNVNVHYNDGVEPFAGCPGHLWIPMDAPNITKWAGLALVLCREERLEASLADLFAIAAQLDGGPSKTTWASAAAKKAG